LLKEWVEFKAHKAIKNQLSLETQLFFAATQNSPSGKQTNLPRRGKYFFSAGKKNSKIRENYCQIFTHILHVLLDLAQQEGPT